MNARENPHHGVAERSSIRSGMLISPINFISKSESSCARPISCNHILILEIIKIGVYIHDYILVTRGEYHREKENFYASTVAACADSYLRSG